MPSPFPGMNPYLENSELWTEVHHRLITAIADAIESNLSPQYRVAIEKRIYLCEPDKSELVGIPDVTITSQKKPKNDTFLIATLPAQTEAIEVTITVPEEVREGYLEIRDVINESVVTVIEVLSPTNKRAGIGREQYIQKRQEVLASPTHLIEIDLLRSGKPMQIIEEVPKTDYRILIALGNRRPNAYLYGFSIRQEIPSFSIPLRRGEAEPLVNLQSLLIGVYNRARFDLAIDYNLEPIPSLKEEDKIWTDTLLKEQGLRQ